MCYLCPFLDTALSKMVQGVGIREEKTAKYSINLPFLGTKGIEIWLYME